MVKILPSILSADFADLTNQLAKIETSGADMHHVDVMDGHFVPNLSFGPVVIKDINRIATIPLDIHLMISHPSKYLEEYLSFKPELLTLHAEVDDDIIGCLQKIRNSGSKAGLSIKPGTSLENVKDYLKYVDVLLIMSVEPGFGGQSFIPESIEKIRLFKDYFRKNELDILIEVDGGINQQTAKECIAAGADWLVAGSSVYTKDQNYQENIKNLREEK